MRVQGEVLLICVTVENIFDDLICMKDLKRWFILLSMLLGISHPATAIVVNDLYVSEVAVENRADQTRVEATRNALAKVIVKVTGREDILAHPAIERALSNSSTYLQEYSYQSGADNQTLLSVRFSKVALERVFSAAAISVWPSNRPQILVLLVERDISGIRLVLPNSAEQNDGQENVSPTVNAYNAVAEIARNRGLAAVAPLLDIEDQLILDAQTLWRDQSAAIVGIVNRYNPDAVLVGRVNKTSSGNWLIGWWFQHNQQFDVYDSQSNELTDALDAGLALTGRYLASIYSVTPSSSEVGLTVRLSGIKDFSDYAHAFEYLRGLAVVESVQVAKVDGFNIDLVLALNGELSVFEDALRLDRKLEKVLSLDTDVGSSTISAPLLLRWNGG
ncbi:hypothetical protein MAH4_22770 [Sessilibacter sp. MAH4]